MQRKKLHTGVLNFEGIEQPFPSTTKGQALKYRVLSKGSDLSNLKFELFNYFL